MFSPGDLVRIKAKFRRDAGNLALVIQEPEYHSLLGMSTLILTYNGLQLIRNENIEAI